MKKNKYNYAIGCIYDNKFATYPNMQVELHKIAFNP